MAEGTGDVTSAFRKALNRHGYGFQYAVLKEAERLFSSGQSYWIPWLPEFPVEIRGAGTRIDLLFRHRNRPYYLVCECKRVNRSTANWCFARAPRPAQVSFAGRSYMETLRSDGGESLTELKDLVNSDRIFQIALEVRSREKGDETGKGRGEIEEAATQVCRGLNGLMQLFHDRRAQLMKPHELQVSFIPAVITTARVLATEADIAAANLDSGEIGNLEPELTERDWIWYDYPQSPGLKHGLPNVNASADLREVLYHDYVRRIAIISPSGLSGFLGMSVWEL